MATFTSRDDDNHLVHLMMAALLEPTPPAVHAAAAVALGRLLSGGCAGTLVIFQTLFLEAAAAREPDQMLVREMRAELAAVQPRPAHCRHWTVTVRALN